MPVDGPSAGIAIATAIYSAIKKIKINNCIAMTGEIGVLGGVKPIGGVKAKIMGARRGGAKVVIIPKDNWSESLGESKDVKIHIVESIGEVFDIVFEKESIRNDNRIEILSASLRSEEKSNL